MRANGNPEKHEYELREFSPIALVSELVQQGTERFFATQRILLDLIMRQNSMTLDALRQALPSRKSVPEPPLAELAAEGISNFVAGMRVLLHFARQQSDVAMQGVRERVDGSAMASAITDILRRSVDTFIELQQKNMTLAAKQTEAWLESIQTGEPYNGKGLPETFREAVENMVQSQKDFLDIIAEETTAATEAKKSREPMERTSMMDLAMQASHNLIDAEKKLLDVAAKQVDVNLKTVKRTVEAIPPMPRVDFRRLTRNTVVNFVDAQKALIDVMMKPRRPSPPRHTQQLPAAKPARKRTSRKTKAATA